MLRPLGLIVISAVLYTKMINPFMLFVKLLVQEEAKQSTYLGVKMLIYPHIANEGKRMGKHLPAMEIHF